MEFIARLVLVCLSMTLVIKQSTGQSVVTTTIGDIEGMNHPFANVVQYLGVPYAEPPTGLRRFQQPLPKSRMPGVYKADKYGAKCPQLPSLILSGDGPQDEDCLFLNIVVPTGNATHLPVMVFIHGGGFAVGESNVYDGSILALSGEVIIVTLNYRLGALGFLSTGDIVSRGNYGLWDQILALHWVNDNIHAFGADTSRITVFGESAGAASIELLAMSPRVNGLFQRIAVQSGYALSNHIIQATPELNANTFAAHMNCTRENTEDMIACLRSATVAEIIAAQALTRGLFMPAIDGDLIPAEPRDLVDRSQQYDMMIGVNKDEGRLFVDRLPSVSWESPGLAADAYNQFVNFMFSLENAGHLAELFVQFYDANNDVARAMAVSDLYSDLFFVLSTVQHARAHGYAHRTRTYMYRFDPYTPLLWWGAPLPWADGATHGDELLYLFGAVQVPQLLNISVTEAEMLLSRQMITYWTNFAKSGNPNWPSQTGLVTTWPTFDPEEERFIIFDRDMTEDSIGSHMFNDRVHFWEEHLPIFGEVGPTTTMTSTAGTCFPHLFLPLSIIIALYYSHFY